MLKPPIAPMLAKATDEIPVGDYFYEPKWDGFRAIIFIGDSIQIGSRGEKELTRYFPELVEQFRNQLPQGTVIDGEIIVPQADSTARGFLDFSALQQRIHPAASRVNKLAQETPASFVAFDLLAANGESLLQVPFEQRRQALEKLLANVHPPLHLTSTTRDIATAREWFEQFEGAGLDGVVAKGAGVTYQPDVRAMLKIKHFRTADCVVAGLRPHKSDADAVGALLLGLFDDAGTLHYVGSTSSFSMAVRREMREILRPLEVSEEHPWLVENPKGRVPGELSRWSGKKDLSFIALDPRLVCEVRYDQLEGDRFRHTTTFMRWRSDREAESCTYDQLQLPEPYDLNEVMS